MAKNRKKEMKMIFVQQMGKGADKMKWITKDMDVYLQAKEYVDTAVIPLIPVSLEGNLKNTVSMGEFITILSNEVERQFKGRIILFPAFTYSNGEVLDIAKNRLNQWTSDLISGGMKHTIFITSDSSWKQVEADLNGSLIWLPTLPLEYVEEKYKQTMLQDQMKQLVTLFTNIWQR
ncbi:YpiF family protein [Fredinandcohnia sp. QZ13]|uniref:YpiF family protein n=1 Tax=Fredinandcohnia sp. QZ13 TaxID=3073144 RepID=UPI0028534C86|nr:YpiF family protein [Fredinandcohnia sp. QZ13]MDR4888702.1 YpiF family protein [Fredinandcohnia sp. QZ13]